MTYYPKNRIQTDLYTNGGELFFVTTGKSYIGFYWSTYDGKFFTGRNQNDIPIAELTKLNSEDDVQITNEIISQVPSNSNLPGWQDLMVMNYESISDKNYGGAIIPSLYYPLTTEEDYKLGEFQRYFCKKNNEYQYIEINKETFDNLDQKNNKYFWQLYEPFQIPWRLTGGFRSVIITNKRIVFLKMKNHLYYGFNQYLRYDFLKYYVWAPKNNIYTSGGELSTIKRADYTGYYHVEADIGPVAGSYPSHSPQTRLFFNELML